MKVTKKILLLCAMSFLFLSNVAKANINCWLYDKLPAQVDVVNLGGISINVGPEIANGTIVFQSTYRSAAVQGLMCTTEPGVTYVIPSLMRNENTPMPLATGVTGTYSGQAYETGVPGLAAVVTKVVGPIPETYTIVNKSGTGDAGQGWTQVISLKIIKTGTVSPGIINGANLPSVYTEAQATAGVSGLPLTTQKLSFAGQLNVVSSSCTTPDVTVNLGKYSVSETFTGIGSASPWVDSSMTLTNCPAFHGYFSSANSSLTEYGSVTLGPGTPTPNSLYLTITPTTSVLDYTNGIFSTISGAGTASGVALQLARGDFRDPESLIFARLASSFSMNVSSTTATDIKIPLAVRYIQRDATVKAGKADGKVTVRIDYR
ncbi:fimbrial protein [Edaphovirga cremea]|uniref:fimbrial protein n=1 Tax=Edaphovirga cremea TaxID=2267246 RepID=UPI000DEFE640|nr:fimbrial protein [Edaphovirga cremea]